MDSKCAICGKHSDLFSLRFDADETDAGKSWTTHVCGTCWEVIAAIARRACEIAGTAPEETKTVKYSISDGGTGQVFIGALRQVSATLDDLSGTAPD